jgi:nifR3 family TIM-barrel protein
MTVATDPPHRSTLPTPAGSGLSIGRHRLATPVVLAPMAGITNRAFRRLCREFSTSAGGDCLYVSEMITSRALVERSPETMRLIEHDAAESPRSVQVYGVDPLTVRLAVRMLVSEDRADHIDMNFGCPVPKVTRKGGGAALPWKLGLFREIVAGAVTEAQRCGVPVTVKMRMGIDDQHLTYLDAARIAAAEGVAAIALHARTAAQSYSGQADWTAIARLKEAVDGVPVLGNGDIWSAQDALDMMARTGCDGVVVGRGCLGRPWLFADLAAAFAGSPQRWRPRLGQVTATLRRHAEYLAEFYGTPDDAGRESSGEVGEGERRACRDIRKHIAWYLKGFRAGHEIRHRLALVDGLAALDELLSGLDPTIPWPGSPAEGPRGRAGTPRTVALPEHWLASRELTGPAAAAVAAAEESVSGG